MGKWIDGLVDYWIGDGGGAERMLITPPPPNSITPFLSLAPKVGIAPTSPPLQGGANLPQLLGENEIPSTKLQSSRKAPRFKLQSLRVCAIMGRGYLGFLGA